MAVALAGIATGCVYALVALGFSLIYRTTGIVNFAQGGYVMLGGMGTYYFLSIVGLPYPLAALGGIAIATVTGLILWVFVVQPLWRRRAPSYVLVLATLVFVALMGDIVSKTLGTNPQTLPEWVPSFHLEIGGTGVSGQYVWVVLVSLGLITAIAAVLRYTTLGKQMRACAANRDTSELLGINPEFVGLVAVVGTAVIGGIGGVVNAPAQFTSFQAALVYGIYGFVAAVLGGFGSLWGALAGGILVGLLQAFVGRYISTTYETFIAFGVLLIFLAFRPQGILGSSWEQQDR
jgi:branched-chain amino acid transport system permease protein